MASRTSLRCKPKACYISKWQHTGEQRGAGGGHRVWSYYNIMLRDTRARAGVIYASSHTIRSPDTSHATHRGHKHTYHQLTSRVNNNKCGERHHLKRATSVVTKSLPQTSILATPKEHQTTKSKVRVKSGKYDQLFNHNHIKLKKISYHPKA